MSSTDVRAGLFITARMRSTRLPAKMLTDVAGRSALAWHFQRLLIPRLPSKRLLCTSLAPEDLALVQLARDTGWSWFRGAEEDVLRRYLAAAEEHGLDLVVNVDGDDLLCSTSHIDLIIERFTGTGADFVRCEGLPLGGAPIGVKTSALADVCARKGESDTQGWGKYFLEPGAYQVETIPAEDHLRRPDYRLTLDYPEDLVFFRALIGALGPERLSLPEVVAYLDAHPEVRAMNEGVQEQYWANFHAMHGKYSLGKRPKAGSPPQRPSSPNAPGTPMSDHDSCIG